MRSTIVVSVALAFALTGCDESTSPKRDRDADLVGSWSLNDPQARADGDTSRFVFKGDGTFEGRTLSVEQRGSSFSSFRSSNDCTSRGNWSTSDGTLAIAFTMTCDISATTTNSVGTKDTTYQNSHPGQDTCLYSIRGTTLTFISTYADGGKVEYDTTTFVRVAS